jgi:site-specific DNA-cytosine methylase
MTPKALTILDLCGGTGAWSLPYRQAGYRVEVVTLPFFDVREYHPPTEIHGILAAPPCTEFAASGARWWRSKPPERLQEALEIVDACLRIIQAVNPKWWALENPVGRLRRLRPNLGRPTLIFDPCDFGDPWTKRTLVWGNFNLPARSPVPAKDFWGWRKLGGKSERTKTLRSITPPGFALAFFRANP